MIIPLVTEVTKIDVGIFIVWRLIMLNYDL